MAESPVRPFAGSPVPDRRSFYFSIRRIVSFVHDKATIRYWRERRLSRANLRTGLLPRLLLCGQIAWVLVVGAGLISSSLVRVYRTGPGFDPNNINLVSVRMTKQPLESVPLTRLYRSLQDKIAALPGVQSASIFSTIPYSGSSINTTYSMPGGRNTPELFSIWISPQYLQTMRIPLLAGRDFAWSDTLSTGKKIILSRSAAAAIFPHRNALGQHVGTGKEAMEVIGIVGDAKYGDIRKPAPFEAYHPITQNDEKKPSYTFVVRLEGPAAHFASAVPPSSRAKSHRSPLPSSIPSARCWTTPSPPSA